MKHLNVVLYYSRFRVIHIGVIRTKLIIVKSLILLIIAKINMAIIIYMIFLLCVGLRVGVYVNTSTLPHLLPPMYDFMID